MNLLKAILLKVGSAFVFAVMSVLVRWLGERYPVGQIVFFRSVFAILPVIVIYAWRNELLAAVRTTRLRGHLGRGMVSIGGMFFNFSALARLPLVDATAIQFSAPLMTVALAAVFLKERVRAYRWWAVIVGFGGIVVMLAPHFDPKHYATAAASATTVGVIFALAGAVCNAGAVIQTRRLTESETTSSIVFYFSLICSLAGLATWPLGKLFPSWGIVWLVPDSMHLVALMATGLCGGIAHILLTESYRWAPASVIAPFDYTTMLWAFVLGYLVFGEVPTIFVFTGAAIIAGAGLFVIWRERRLRMQRLSGGGSGGK
jgi:drug/metabolite transporter (DMT)-like permease